MKYGQLVGIGNTADVYEWEEGKVLKLFHPGYSKNAAENEFHNAIAIRDMDFAKPKVYDMVLCEDRIGIIYDRAEGETLLSWVVRTGDIDGCAEHMAKLHKSIIRNKIDNIMNYKDFLMNGLRKHPSMNLKKQEEIVLKINLLSDGDDLCHGDFHPGNIFLSPDGNTMAIDFMNVCC